MPLSPRKKREAELYYLIKKIKKDVKTNDLTADQIELIAATALRAHTVMSNLNQGMHTLANIVDRLCAYHFSITENKPYEECVVNESDPESLKKYTEFLSKIFYSDEFQYKDDRRTDFVKAYQEKMQKFASEEVEKALENQEPGPITTEEMRKKTEELWEKNPEINEHRKLYDKHQELTMRKLLAQVLSYVRLGG